MSGHGHGNGKPAWHPGVKPEWQDPNSPENIGVPQDPKPKAKDPGPAPTNHHVGDGKHRLRRRYDPKLRKEFWRKRLIRWFWMMVVFTTIILFLGISGKEQGLAIGFGGPLLLFLAIIFPGG